MKHLLQLQSIVPDNIQDILLQNQGVDGLSIFAIAAAISVCGFIGYNIYQSLFSKNDSILNSLVSLRSHLKNDKEIHDYKKRFEQLCEDISNSNQENSFSEGCSGISQLDEPILSICEDGNLIPDFGVSSENQFFLGNPQDPDLFFDNVQDFLEAKKTIFYEEVGKLSSVSSDWCFLLEKLVEDMDDSSGPLSKELLDSIETITFILENPSSWGSGFDLNAVKEQAFSIVDLCCQNPEFLWFGETFLNILTN